MGPDIEHAHPHAVFICKDIVYGDAVRKAILKSLILHDAGWGQACAHLKESIEIRGEVDDNTSLDSGPMTVPEVYFVSDPPGETLCGASVRVKLDSDRWRLATMGGVLKINHNYYGLTVAHVFDERDDDKCAETALR